jgi:hypothetical protein
MVFKTPRLCKILTVICMVLLCATQAVAQQQEEQSNAEWVVLGNSNSAHIAALRTWTLQTSHGFRWDDGRAAFVTYWQNTTSKEFLRCVDFVDTNFANTNSYCAAPVQR